ncbi:MULTISPECIES: TetR/AcrR family transcriptional regulator [Mycolicibacter]|uniref:TetR/AcrR family transcriptional regulator n=2 Tax=Mycolicibacter TaxID=1073531 RepID=A0A9X7IQ72_9MYCO|nr:MULTISPECIES: TetR/AcrR family transcriptional regulator [Mycobacteriaceae]OBJ28141.1 TetR family transcriptional regulator [Mycolicibacter heraklionensis]PQM53370.1 TetR/AcrR family transcriptional regulator [Mycolicibacter virginiensis]ULP46278.1 TetR/AcrR family transcriptional regulator [Mycolicibacter virginiensis]
MSTPQLGRPVGADGGQTRQRIIAATIACVAELGYARTTIRQIARTAGVTSANIYNYFPNKAELVAAAIATRAEIALPRLRRAAQRPGTVVDRIEAVLDESGNLMREHPDLATFEWAIRAQNAVTVYPGETESGGLEALRDIITGIVDDGDSRLATGARPAIEVTYALVYGLTELAATGTPEAYHAALAAAKRLIRGTLFATH